MLRLLLFVCFSLGVVPQLFGQPGGGPGTGGQGVCQVAVLRNCLEISGYGGRCIDTTSHSCAYDVIKGKWACSPERGVEMIDNKSYIDAIPAATGEHGWTHWVWDADDPCGFLEFCECNPNLVGCRDDLVYRPAWGPGNDLPDPSRYGIPPATDCVGQ
jgi:hypothetical protein